MFLAFGLVLGSGFLVHDVGWVFGYWFLDDVDGYCLLVVGSWFLVFGSGLWVLGSWFVVCGYWFWCLVRGLWFLVIGSGFAVIGYWLLVLGF